MSDNAMSNEALQRRHAGKSGFWREAAQGDETLANVGVTIRAMMIAAAVFAVFGSAEMRHAARNLPGNAISDVLVEASDRWHVMMQRLGPALAEPAVRNAFDELRDKHW
jgi:hypothetical protein